MRMIWTVTIGLLVGITLAQAQEGQAGPPQAPREGGFGRGPGRGGFRGPGIGFLLFDTDRDGTLSASEIDAAAAVLAKLDKNQDGQVTIEELRAALPGGPGRGRREEGNNSGAQIAEDMVKTWMAFDKNGDGKLTRDELPERMQGIFTRADADKDGVLTEAEVRNIATTLANPPRMSGPGGAPEGEHREAERREGSGGPGGPGGAGREMNFIRMDPLLRAIDADGDGILSAEEIKNAPAAIRKLDANSDGKITREEAMPVMR